MDSKDTQLRIFFFPFMAQGHSIPAIDMAKLFASHGVHVSIITTPLNAPRLAKSINNSGHPGREIELLIINFPSAAVGLPDGCESLDLARTPDMFQRFFRATTMLEPEIDRILEQHRPHCLVADTFFPWTTDVAAKYGILRVVFHGTCFFSLCAAASIIANRPFDKVSSDLQPFVIPNLPHEIKLTRSQVPGFLKEEVETDFIKLYRASKEVESRCYGFLINSFYELEPAYADYYRNVMGRKAWHIGPLSLYSNVKEDKVQRGDSVSIDEHDCLKWLDSKNPNSVLYVSFGSLASLTNSQLLEIAKGLEATGQSFIWVVKKEIHDQAEWLPEGFEKRIEGKGLIIRGWAPQVLILDHRSIGGFVTHCGWNSALEGVTAGLPMVTWPNSAEQFYNEKLITDVLKIGVGVGAMHWGRAGKDLITSEVIEKAVNRVMVGEEAEGMRSRAEALGIQAREAIEEGGSSFSDLKAFFDDIRSRI
ncbi:UDP-glucose flavonoid 3-O-glucosyltransferase 7, partial [Cucurbita argyrosperma subsp. sororia]